MNESTELRYVISEDEFLAVRRLLSWRRPWIRKLVLSVFPVVGLVLALLTWWRGELITMVGALAYAVSPWVLGYVVGTPLARRYYRRSPTLHEAQAMRFDDEGVTFISTVGQSRLHWKHLIRWYQDEQRLLLFIQPGMCFIIPKRADSRGDVLPRLCALLRQHLGPAR
ncbi:hypothetical protein BKK81_02360 [Cupriavidus sp. USMAHM13]|uniref:YcxB family protein n=1 Tax=Cupriavidus sp. USMAHM13 TaxID=1389192 RepID=UPI0008A68E2E|nr:YcxB family protein [Cupriavidus sp. USMAHM13]AOY98264.1 hypothetical protein BKK81_02360 [Cupriavidus sp. USMAHM13]